MRETGTVGIPSQSLNLIGILVGILILITGTRTTLEETGILGLHLGAGMTIEKWII